MLEGGCAVFKGSVDAGHQNGKRKEGGRFWNTAWGLAERDALSEQAPSLTDYPAGPVLKWGPRGRCEEPLQMLYGIPRVPEPGELPLSIQSV